MSPPPDEIRYIGMDIHKRYAVIGGVNRDQAVVFKPKKVSYQGWRRWMSKQLRSTDEVVIEATGNSWHIVDEIKPLVKRVVVAHARHVKLIAAARVKTDKVDTLNLARLLAANLIPEVWVPPILVREVRRLVAQRWQITRGRVRVQNELHSLLHRHNIVAPAGQGTLFRTACRPFWETLAVSSTDKLQIQHDLAQLDLFNQRLEEIDAEVASLSWSPAWEPQVRLLLQLPGFGALTAMTVRRHRRHQPLCHSQEIGWLCRTRCQHSRQRRQKPHRCHHQSRAQRLASGYDSSRPYGCSFSSSLAEALPRDVSADAQTKGYRGYCS